MSRRTITGFFLLLAVLFLLTNRAAYKGYFSDDEVDNLSWTPFVSASDFAKGMATPLFLKDNFRPVGHLYFKVMEATAGLDFPKYVGVIHLFHFLNAWLVWVLARRLGAKPMSAAVGVLFFALHMALFDTLWKPMYVFDVLCATFCLTSIVCYIDRRWVLSFVAFWLAYKAKELAVMLPAVLLCYEWLLGERRWKPLVPFFAASLSFGLQGILLNPNQDNDYTFRFTPAAVAKTSAVLRRAPVADPLSPGSRCLAAPFLTREPPRLVRTGDVGNLLFPADVSARAASSAPTATCRSPGIAIAASALDMESRRTRAAVAAFFVLWLPWNYYRMRVERRAKLAKDDEVARLDDHARPVRGANRNQSDSFVFAGAPAGFQRWGIEGAIKYFYKRGDLNIHWVEDPDAAKTMREPRVRDAHMGSRERDS